MAFCESRRRFAVGWLTGDNRRRFEAMVDSDGAPMGLLASGSLLLAVAEGDSAPALDAIRRAGVAAERIGTIRAPGLGVIMNGDIQGRPVPRFARDEVARFLEEHGD